MKKNIKSINFIQIRILNRYFALIYILLFYCLINSTIATPTPLTQSAKQTNKNSIKHKKHSKPHKKKHYSKGATDPSYYLSSYDTNNSTSNSKPRLYSYSALAMDASNGQVIISKNPDVQLPIASITKLMTAMITLDAETDLDDYVTIANSDIDTLRNTFSRLKVGMQFRRRDLLLLALMSSENRAAHALARTSYTGGITTFIQKMNQKAKNLGMLHTQFYDPTGLTVENQSTAEDLSKMVQAAFEYNLIRQYTTTKDADVMLGRNYIHRYINSDALVRANKFQITLSKTGFINEAGHCLVLYCVVNNRPIVMVFLNSSGKGGRLVDALAVKNYINHL